VVVGNGRGLSELLVRRTCAAMVENKLICALLLNMHMCLPIFALDGTSAVDDEVGCTNWVPGRRSTGARQDLSSLLGLFSVDERLQTMSSLLGLFSVDERLQTMSSLLDLFSIDERLQTMSSLLGLFSIDERLQTMSSLLGLFSVDECLQTMSSLLGLFPVNERLQTMSSLLGLFSVNERLQTTVEEQYVLEIDQFGGDLLQGHLEESA
jgi:hypothetical protein